MKQMKRTSVGTAELAWQVFGDGEIDVVVEMGLGACMGEWRPMARQLAERYTVLVYERAGCGSSGESRLERTPANIAAELHELLERLGCRKKLILLGHSQGGLYAARFARSYPERTAALVLLDPLSPGDGDFKRKLPEKLCRQSGADKSEGLRLSLWLARLGMAGLLKKAAAAGPPLCYARDFAKEDLAEILTAAGSAQTYRTALREYRQAHLERNTAPLRRTDGFPRVPLCLVTHTSAVLVEEMMRRGALRREDAERVEALWQKLMGEYLAFGGDSQWLRAENSGHYLHLTEPELVLAAMEWTQSRETVRERGCKTEKNRVN